MEHSFDALTHSERKAAATALINSNTTWWLQYCGVQGSAWEKCNTSSSHTYSTFYSFYFDESKCLHPSSHPLPRAREHRWRLEHRLVNWEFCLLAQLLPHHCSCSILLSLLRFKQRLVPNPNTALQHWPAENHGLRLKGADSELRAQNQIICKKQRSDSDYVLGKSHLTCNSETPHSPETCWP